MTPSEQSDIYRNLSTLLRHQIGRMQHLELGFTAVLATLYQLDPQFEPAYLEKLKEHAASRAAQPEPEWLIQTKRLCDKLAEL